MTRTSTATSATEAPSSIMYRYHPARSYKYRPTNPVRTYQYQPPDLQRGATAGNTRIHTIPNNYYNGRQTNR